MPFTPLSFMGFCPSGVLGRSYATSQSSWVKNTFSRTLGMRLKNKQPPTLSCGFILTPLTARNNPLLPFLLSWQLQRPPPPSCLGQIRDGRRLWFMEESYLELYGVCSGQVQSWSPPFFENSQGNEMQAPESTQFCQGANPKGEWGWENNGFVKIKRCFCMATGGRLWVRRNKGVMGRSVMS